jgi:hypothetical protein
VFLSKPSTGEPIRPFHTQIADLTLLCSHDRAALWNRPGTGKTLPAQARAIWSAAQGNKVLCLVPPSLITQFFGAFSIFVGVSNFLKVRTFTGSRGAKEKLLKEWRKGGWPDILVLSYRGFEGASEKAKESAGRSRRALEEAEEALASSSPEDKEEAEGLATMARKRARTLCEQGWRNWLDVGYNDLVIDEAVKIKHPGSGLHKAVKHFCGTVDESNGLVLLTGTPLETTPEDAYGPISLLTPRRYGSKRDFTETHVVLQRKSFMKGGKERAFNKVIAYRNMEYLHESLFLQARRVTLADVMTLPHPRVQEILVDLSNSHLALYKKLMRERMLEFKGQLIDATSQVSLRMKAQQILLCPEQYEEGHKENALLDAMDEILLEINPAFEKVIIFAYFQRSIEKLAGHLKKFNPAMVYGKSNTVKQIAKFKEDKTCRVGILQVGTGGVGVDGLQDLCQYALFVEPIQIPGLWDQSICRIHRPGQRNQVMIYLLTVNQTISVTMRNELCRREEYEREAMKDKRTILSELDGEGGIKGELVTTA